MANVADCLCELGLPFVSDPQRRLLRRLHQSTKPKTAQPGNCGKNISKFQSWNSTRSRWHHATVVWGSREANWRNCDVIVRKLPFQFSFLFIHLIFSPFGTLVDLQRMGRVFQGYFSWQNHNLLSKIAFENSNSSDSQTVVYSMTHKQAFLLRPDIGPDDCTPVSIEKVKLPDKVSCCETA